MYPTRFMYFVLIAKVYGERRRKVAVGLRDADSLYDNPDHAGWHPF
jgi:hypothetical protein